MQQHEHPLPANPDAEQGVLACLLYNPRSIARVADTLTETHFVSDAHGLIYRAMLALHSRQRACSVANVVDELARTGHLEDIGRTQDAATARLEMLQMSTLSIGSVEDYAESIRRCAMHRRLIAIGTEIAASGYAQDEDALQRAEDLIYGLALGADTKTVAPLKDVLDRYMSEFDRRRDDFREGIVSGVPANPRRKSPNSSAQPYRRSSTN